MDNKQHKSIKGISKSPVKVDARKQLIIGSIIATMIAITPYLFNLYESVPNVKVWDTFLFTYDSNYYESMTTVAWTLMNKLIPLFLLFIWFFTCRHWWYHVILVPIFMYFYQIIIILNDDLRFADNTNQIYYLLPVIAIVVPSIYLIRAQMFNKLNTIDKSMEELEEEFKIKPKTIWKKLKQYF